MQLQREKLGMILKVGLPTAIGGSTMQLGFLLMSKNVFVYGTEAMAAYGIGNKVNGLITLPSNAIGSATATIVGQNMGAKQPERAEQGYRFSMWISVVIFVHWWYDLIKRYDLHGDRQYFLQRCRGRGNGSRLFKRDGTVVLYQRSI